MAGYLFMRGITLITFGASRDPWLGVNKATKAPVISPSADGRSFCFSDVPQKQACSSHHKNKKPSANWRMGFRALSGCRDLNPGPLAPQTSTLTGLSYIPRSEAVQK